MPNDASAPLDAAIVGGGPTGLALGTLLARRRPDWRILVLEREARAGGKVGTRDDAGFRTDTGPLGVLPDEEGALPLAREVGLDPVPAAPVASKRWIYRSGGLRPLPTGPRQVATTELAGPLAKARAVAEPFVPASDAEETVHAFLARRFGRGAADALAEPFVLGVAAGDPRELSVDALFPALRRMEREHGSLVRAMRAAGRRARARRREAAAMGNAEGAPPRRGLHGFGAAGMGAFADALATTLGGRLRTGVGVRALARGEDGEGWRVALDDGSEVRARRVAVTVPAWAAADLVRPLDEGLADGLAAVPYVSMRVIGLGYDRIDVAHPLDGFGFLAPSGEGLRSLGVLFGSELFPGQAPPAKTQLRVLMGGRRDPEATRLPPEEAVAAARRDLRLALGVAAEPESTTVVDWPRAIPQYRLGHPERAAALVARAAASPGLQLAGTAYFGIGLNDAVRDARRVAAAWLGSGTGGAPSDADG